MVRNYFRVAVRNILKHKFYAAINILGMSVGIAACLLITLWVSHELSYDRFHEHADRMYRVNLHGRINDQDILTTSTCPPLAEALVEEVPGVEAATRIGNWWNGNTLKYDDKVFAEERLYLADSNFFQFFSYKLLLGDPGTALKEPNSIVLSEDLATKYFGTEDPLGKLITLSGQTLKVTGVAETAPANSHFRYNALISAGSAEQMQRTAWLNNFLQTYFILEKGASLSEVEAKFKDLVVKYVGPEVQKFLNVSLEQFLNEGGGAFGYFSTPVPDIHLRSVTRDEMLPGGNIMHVYFFTGIGLFIVVIACINFMNLSTARSAGRAKEVGLRKTLGSFREQMIAQFLAESIIYVFLAVVIALVLCYVALPQFNILSGKELGMDAFFNPRFVALLVGLVVIVGVFAGSYPAFYLTSFKAVEVLKGNIRAGVKSKGVRSVLVICQFALSIFLIIFTAVVYQQLSFMANRNMGIDKHNVVVLPGVGALGNNRDAFKTALAEQTGIIAASYTNNEFPGVNSTSVFKKGGSEEDHMMGYYYADYDHLDVMKFELVEGRFFSRDFPSDSTAIIMNEAAVREFGFENPLQSEILSMEDGAMERLRVIGVVKNFNFESLKQEVRPLAIRLENTSWRLMARYEGNPADVLAAIETLWKQYAPDEPFTYTFLDQDFDALFRSEQQMGQLFTLFSGLAIFIACLGLFALSAFTAEQRTKEIGIRKSLGATTTGLTLLLSKEFTKLVLISFVPAALAGWFVVDSWLDGFAYRVDISPWIFVGSGVMAIIIAWLTVSFQSIKAASINPVQSLRYE